MDVRKAVMGKAACIHASMLRAKSSLVRKMADTRGQATTEYAILVGVLVVVAVLAITLFKPKIEELWGAIADSINAL